MKRLWKSFVSEGDVRSAFRANGQGGGRWNQRRVPRESSPLIWIPLVALLLFILAIRVNVSFSAWPYLWYWDEWQVFRGSMRMLEEGHPIIPFFNYGLFPLTFAALVSAPTHAYLVISGQLESPTQLRPWPDYEWSVGFPELLATQRLLWIVIGIVAVLLVWLMTQRLFGWPLAFVAASIFGVNGLATTAGSALMVDGLGVCLVAGTLATSVWALQSPRSTQLLVAGGVLAGLAAATKYNYGAVLMAPFLASVFLIEKQGKLVKTLKRPLLVLGAALLVFVMAMPAIIAYPRLFWSAIQYERNHYQTGTPGAESDPWLGQLLFQIDALASNVGWLALVAVVLGLLGMVTRSRMRPALLVLIAPVIPFLVVMLSGRLNYHRNYLFLYPQLAVLAAAGLATIGTVLMWRGLPRFPANLVAAVVGLLIVVPLAVDAVSQARGSAALFDTRTQALRVLRLEICQTPLAGTVYLQRELNWPSSIGLDDCPGKSVAVADLDEIESRMTLGDFAIVATEQSDVLTTAVPITSFAGSALPLLSDTGVPRRPIVNPALTVLKSERARDPRIPRSDPDQGHR